MLRTLTLLICALSLPAFSQTSERSTPLVRAVSKVWKGVVTLEAFNQNRFLTKRYGAGFVVHVSEEYAYILSCAHIFKEGYDKDIRIKGQEKLYPRWVTQSPKEDLALLRVEPTAELSPLSLEKQPPLLGETVFTVGNPNPYDRTVTLGNISSLSRPIYYLESPVLQIQAPINGGNSGGPLLSLDGTVLGMVTAVHETLRGVAFATSTHTLKDFLCKKAQLKMEICNDL